MQAFVKAKHQIPMLRRRLQFTTPSLESRLRCREDGPLLKSRPKNALPPSSDSICGPLHVGSHSLGVSRDGGGALVTVQWIALETINASSVLHHVRLVHKGYSRLNCCRFGVLGGKLQLRDGTLRRDGPSPTSGIQSATDDERSLSSQ